MIQKPSSVMEQADKPLLFENWNMKTQVTDMKSAGVKLNI